MERYKKSTWLQDRDELRKHSDREQDRVREKRGGGRNKEGKGRKMGRR